MNLPEVADLPRAQQQLVQDVTEQFMALGRCFNPERQQFDRFTEVGKSPAQGLLLV